MSQWDRMAKVVDRYERLALCQLRELKDLQRNVIENKYRDTISVRQQISQLEDHLLSGLKELLSHRAELNEESQEFFDTRIEPIRRQIQSVVAFNAKLPPPRQTSSSNPFLEENTDSDENPYEAETKRYAEATDVRLMENRLKAQQAKEMAEATAKLNMEMADLEDIFSELNLIVHQQHEIVDSIEEHVEKSVVDVNRGNQQLKKAVAYKTAKAPVVAAAVGGLAVGGPVGFAAGSVIAGVVAGVGGLVAGVYGGRWFRDSSRKNCQD